MRHAAGVYSLVSAAVLAADVVRHPHASRLADTLDRVLALTPEEAAGLGSPAADEVRQRVLGSCTPRASFAVGDVLTPDAQDPLAVLATRLDASLLGTLDDLHAMVLREDPVAGLPTEAQQVVCDALTAAWAGPEVELRDLRALTAPWDSCLDPVPPSLPERPWTGQLRSLLEEVPRRTTEQWKASERAHHQDRRPRWSEVMHLASAAAWRADRLHDVARAQLAAARALAVTHTGVSPYSAARVVTAAVQGVCTRDVLDPSVVEALGADWEAGSGGKGPPR